MLSECLIDTQVLSVTSMTVLRLSGKNENFEKKLMRKSVLIYYIDVI